MREPLPRSGPATEGQSGSDDRERGLPSVVVMLLVVLVCAAASYFDLRVTQRFGFPFGTAFIGGCLLAVLVVRRRGVLLVLCTPPLLMIVAGVLAAEVFLRPSGSLESQALTVGVPVMTGFPLMVAGTVVALLAGSIRLFSTRRSRHD
ncbi:hypothetical protein FPZ12_042390 [Amycolatopsis acidicola]|uniref:DUF6542 domain-containing protein n=1 Tax=Amycolatopsis acidicola TaxID=2596893 RepID=A0A5N0ULB7_9PSEU|nr:DUF6542 domain-containing protein [Amycolatopsis acidicola]KAA9149866.1 hypothetical protein FPZ12_042390 [Amycolatopsis acidicola]